MPEGIYLDARKLGEAELARQMFHIITDKEQYYNFFKWHRYYSFHGTEESAETDDFCAFCATINDLVQRNESSIYVNLAQWWNGNVQVINNLGSHYHESIKVIPITTDSVSQPKIIIPKKKKLRFRGEKLNRKIISNTEEEAPVKKVKKVDETNNTPTTTLRPTTQTKEEYASATFMSTYVNGSVGQANNSGSWTKQEFEFEYDYER